jgi:hypothetical protein
MGFGELADTRQNAQGCATQRKPNQGFNSPLPKNQPLHFIFGLSPLPLPSFHKTMGVVTFGETENKPGSPQVILENVKKRI